MSTERGFRFTPGVVIGLGVMLLGIALMLERFGVVEVRTLLRLWPLLLVLFGASLVAQALRGPGRNGDDTGIGGIWVIVVIVALLAWQAQRRADTPGGETDAPVVSLLAVMSQDQRTSLAAGFQGADMTTIMGQTRLDLRQATVASGEAPVIDVFTVMGGAVVYVPRDWSVDVRATPVLGRVRDARLRPANAEEQEEEEEEEEIARNPRERRRLREELRRSETLRGAATLEPLEPPATGRPAPRVVLRGFVLMGELTIRS